MPTISIREGLQYFYLDSGTPRAQDYETIIVIHGHTFHSGTFERLFKPANARNLRIIAINRRGYPGTTPLSQTEVEDIQSSSEESIQRFMKDQGINLALVIDMLVRDLGLPPGRNVTICAWSLGNTFLMNILASIDALEANVRDRLKLCVKGLIMWDPPSCAFGLEYPAGTYCPLYDESIAPEARPAVFGIWVASHWKHGDLSSHDFGQIEQRIPLIDPPPTTAQMSPEELMSMTDMSPQSQVPDTILLLPQSTTFFGVQRRQTEKALLSPAIRAAWGNPNISHLVGDANCWGIIHGQWYLEDLMRHEENVEAGLEIGFKTIVGGNHFVMYDHPETALDALQACIAGDMTPISIPVRSR